MSIYDQVEMFVANFVEINGEVFTTAVRTDKQM